MELLFTVWRKVIEATKIMVVVVFKFLNLELPFTTEQSQVDTESDETFRSYNELYEIFSWMPAKSIIKYSSSLCKGLSKLHLEPHFIRKQCIRSRGQDNGIFLQPMFVRDDDDDQIPDIIESRVLPWQTPSSFGFPHESLDYILGNGRILSSSNGLLLLGRLYDEDDIEFWLCNPATKKWAPLQTPRGYKFIVDEDTSPLIECYPWADGVIDGVEFPNDYTIALPVKCEANGDFKQELLVYSKGSWEKKHCNVKIEGRDVRYDSPVPVFSNTTIGLVVHYLCDSANRLPDCVYMEPFIAAFDLREKKLSREIKLPNGAWDMECDNYWKGSREELCIFKWNDTSICLVRWYTVGGEITVWVLDDYGETRESWRRVMKKTEKELGFGGNEWIMNVSVASGKGLLLATQARVYVYVFDSEGADQGRLEVVGEHGLGCWNVTFMPYANTLRPVSVQNSDAFGL